MALHGRNLGLISRQQPHITLLFDVSDFFVFVVGWRGVGEGPLLLVAAQENVDFEVDF